MKNTKIGIVYSLSCQQWIERFCKFKLARNIDNVWVLKTLPSPKDTIHASFALELINQFQDQVYEDYFEVWDTVKSLQATKTLFMASQPIAKTSSWIKKNLQDEFFIGRIMVGPDLVYFNLFPSSDRGRRVVFKIYLASKE